MVQFFTIFCNSGIDPTSWYATGKISLVFKDGGVIDSPQFGHVKNVYCLYWIRALVLRQIASECIGLQKAVDTFKTDLTIDGERTF
jgi:hypothetical protein